MVPSKRKSNKTTKRRRYRMTTTATKLTKLDNKMLELYVKALLEASGITIEQARICTMYALCTYRKDLEKIPLLAVRGMTGTGKSVLLSQMELFVREPKRAAGSTYATVRDEMDKCPTYLIDEGDKISEQLLLCRTDQNDSEITYMTPSKGQGWKPRTVEVFGSTIIARRTPFRDSAIRNRAIVINTKNNPADYKETFISDLDQIVKELRIERLALGAGRIQDTWAPLLEIAYAIDDSIYANTINQAIEAEQDIFRSGQEYELEAIVLHALDNLTWKEDEGKRTEVDIELPELTRKASELGDVKSTKKQVEELLITMGFKVTFTHGVKYVRADTELLESLL